LNKPNVQWIINVLEYMIREWDIVIIVEYEEEGERMIIGE